MHINIYGDIYISMYHIYQYIIHIAIYHIYSNIIIIHLFLYTSICIYIYIIYSHYTSINRSFTNLLCIESSWWWHIVFGLRGYSPGLGKMSDTFAATCLPRPASTTTTKIPLPDDVPQRNSNFPLSARETTLLEFYTSVLNLKQWSLRVNTQKNKNKNSISRGG